MSYRETEQRGFVTLSVVIAFLVVGVSAALFILISGWQATTGERRTLHGTRAQWYADSCADHALTRIRYEPAYAGSESMDIGDGRCSIFPVSVSASESFPVRAEGISDGARARLLVTAEITLDASGAPSDVLVQGRGFVPEF